MAAHILILDHSEAFVRRLAPSLAPSCTLVWARGAQEARARIEAGERFAVVAGRFPRGASSDLLFASLEARAPDAVRVLLFARQDTDALQRALEDGRVQHHVASEDSPEQLQRVLAVALTEHLRRRERSELRARLDFTTEVLERFNHSLDRRLSRQASSMERLSSFVNELARASSLQEIADVALQACCEAFPGRKVEVELWTILEDGHRARASNAAAQGVTRHVRPVQTTDGRNGLLAISEPDQAGARLTREDRTVFAAIASTCSVAVQNEVRKLERDEAQHATILALAKLAEQRDNETGKHLDRVSSYCRLVAEALGAQAEFADQVDARFVRQLERSAPLHDIGKVGIPDAILLKPGKLDEAQWRIMRTHTTIGAETIDSVIGVGHNQGFLRMSRDIAWCHHERWDGQGYPRGLAGEAIPLAARILTVADVYDALTSVRPYKQAWSHERALATLEAGAGSQFDPRLVSVFLERANEVDQIRSRLADHVHDFAAAAPSAATPPR